MEYIYAAMLLHKAGKEINEGAIKAVLEAAGVAVDDARVKALVASLEGVNIDEAIETPIAPPIKDLKPSKLAVANTAGVYPQGNPHGATSIKNTVWAKYDISKMQSMKESAWMVIHAGITNVFIKANPNFAVPLDVMREFEKTGVFSKLSSHLYSTTGVGGATAEMERIGQNMEKDMKSEDIDAVLLVST